MMMYFYIVHSGNTWVNNITEHKKMKFMIYHQSDSIFFFYLHYVHQIMLMMMMACTYYVGSHPQFSEA